LLNGRQPLLFAHVSRNPEYSLSYRPLGYTYIISLVSGLRRSVYEGLEAPTELLPFTMKG